VNAEAEASARPTTKGQTDLAESPFRRYVPLVAWVIVVLALLAIPMRIISYGYLPGGDARRHVAKAFTDKPYTQILVVRSEYSMDHSPGWERLLRLLHQKADWNGEALVSFSIAGLMLCVFYAPLPWLRRPEAWLAALLALMVAIPEVMIRLSQARPLLITEGVFIAVLFAWARPNGKNPSWLKLALTCLGISLSVWMHGAWYLWVLPLAAFFLARAWRTALWLTACFAAGIFLGALFTGKPVEFLRQAIYIIMLVSREHLPQSLLVGELRPSYGEFDSLVLLALVILWRWFQTKRQPEFLREPLFWMILICWVLGFKADRFWADWGVPAVLVWLTWQFEDILPAFWGAVSPKRLIACCVLAAPLVLQASNDLDGRYTFNLKESFLDGNDSSLQGWLPEQNGIFYSAQMEFFYSTFYKNPTADWRYILSMEPALMPPDDLLIFRNIQWNNYAFKAYEPWIKKMLPADRLVVYSSALPNLPQLEWHNAVGNIWLGRLPKKS